MRRRAGLFAGLVGLALWGSGRLAWAQPLPEPPRVVRRLHIPLATLQREVEQRLALRYPLAGLVELSLAVPQLALLPAQNQLRADMAASVSGLFLPQPMAGRFSVDFSLRYEPADRTLRAHDLALAQLAVPGLPVETALWLQTYAPWLAQQALGELVLHRSTPQETALGDLLGLQPGRIQVTDQGLSVELVARPL